MHLLHAGCSLLGPALHKLQTSNGMSQHWQDQKHRPAPSRHLTGIQLNLYGGIRVKQCVCVSVQRGAMVGVTGRSCISINGQKRSVGHTNARTHIQGPDASHSQSSQGKCFMSVNLMNIRCSYLSNMPQSSYNKNSNPKVSILTLYNQDVSRSQTR